MSGSANDHRPDEHWFWQWIIPLAVTAIAVAIGLAFGPRMPLIIAALLVGFGGLAILRWPDLAALAVIGLIYSNLPVVAVQVHGAPGILPAAVLAMLFWPLAYRIVIRRESICFYTALPWAAGYTVVMAAGALLSDYPAEAMDNLLSFLMEGLALYLIVTNVIRTRRSLHATLWVLALCGIVMGGAPLAKKAIGDPLSDFGGLARVDSSVEVEEIVVEDLESDMRATGTIGEQNRYAQFMLLLVPIGLALVHFEQQKYMKWLAAGATLLALVGAALAFSRGAAVACLLAMLIAAATKLIDRRQLAIVAVAGALALCLSPQYLTRLASIGSIVSATVAGEAGNHEDGSVRGRLTEMGAAAMVFRDHMIVGVGPGLFTAYSQHYGQIVGLRSLPEARESHNLLLGIAAENGLLGLITFFGMIAAVGYRLSRARQKALAANDAFGVQVATAMLLVGIIFLCTGLFLHMAFIRYFWMMIAIADSAGQIVLRGDQGGDYLPSMQTAEPAMTSELARG